MRTFNFKSIFVAIFSLFAISANAEIYTGSCGDNAYWSFDSETGILEITGTGDMDDFSYGDTPWYEYCEEIKSVEIAYGITSIGTFAFGDSFLSSVTIPNSVTKIGKDAFLDCINLLSVSIPNSVTRIGDNAFYNCINMTSVSISSSVTKIGEEVFSLCSDLTEINVDEDNQSYSSIDGVLFNKDKSVLIQYPNGKSGAYSIPESVTEIGDDAFSWSRNITSVSIPNSITEIKDNCFISCTKLTSVTIPESVTQIGVFAFGECYSLTSINIPNSITEIKPSTFSSCTSLTSITIPNSVTKIGNYAFFDCSNLASITIPNSVTEIGNKVFEDCYNLTSVTISNSITQIGDNAFTLCYNLNKIYSLNPTPPTLLFSAFNGVPKSIPVYIPKGSKSLYESAEGWNEFNNFIESDFTGVEEGNISATEIKVMAGNGIDICNYYGKLQVVNLAGQVVKETFVNGSAQITLPEGVYIVVTKNNFQKVVL